jgi:hypothetical protein
MVVVPALPEARYEGWWVMREFLETVFAIVGLILFGAVVFRMCQPEKAPEGVAPGYTIRCEPIRQPQRCPEGFVEVER